MAWEEAASFVVSCRICVGGYALRHCVWCLMNSRGNFIPESLCCWLYNGVIACSKAHHLDNLAVIHFSILVVFVLFPVVPPSEKGRDGNCSVWRGLSVVCGTRRAATILTAIPSLYQLLPPIR